jgi:uncharacterized protein with PIN domain
MIDPKEHIVVVGPKKGECYICNASLEKIPSIQIQKQIPIIKKMQSFGRACLSCAGALRDLVAIRIAEAVKGEYQA